MFQVFYLDFGNRELLGEAESVAYIYVFDVFQVFYLDFGNTEWLGEAEVRDIKPQFLHLPFQALQCFLAGILPTDPNNPWPKDASYGHLLYIIYLVNFHRPKQPLAQGRLVCSLVIHNVSGQISTDPNNSWPKDASYVPL